eukprot:GDKH01010871.1.p3 GENE.GDKH01010871.1~~GDKH01010871.1.p3  ORF type:complete len:70 (+),score=4.70 GDKH01010871.1:58-267(+)
MVIVHPSKLTFSQTHAIALVMGPAGAISPAWLAIHKLSPAMPSRRPHLVSPGNLSEHRGGGSSGVATYW